jgi:hypothetical protein
MRHIAIIVCSLLGLAQAGCPAHNIHIVDARNGQVRQQIDGSIGAFSTDIEVKTNHQAMQSCVADTGPMPDGEESDLCVDQVRSDKARRNRTLDWQSSPYYGGYGSYDTYAPPGTVGY